MSELRAPSVTPTLEFATEFLFARRTQVRRELMGPTPEGFRVNVITESGLVRGPALNGTCGLGADWFLVRRDGVGVVDSRVMLEADDGALVYSWYTGVVDFGEDAYDRLMRGEPPQPAGIRIAARFQTAAPKYAWLNRLQAFGIGQNDATGNLWDTYALR